MHNSFALSPMLVLGRGEGASCGSATPDEAGESPDESRPEGCADEGGQLVASPWVEGFDGSPGEGAPSRRLTEQGTPSTLESSLTSSASASSGEIGERTMGAVCSRSALTYCRRRSASRP